MTLSRLLAEIAFEGQRGVAREKLIAHHGIGIIDYIEHLQMLRLVYFTELPYTENPRYIASTEKGRYPSYSSLGVFCSDLRRVA